MARTMQVYNARKKRKIDISTQGAEAGALQHWHLQEGPVRVELLHQRYLRAPHSGVLPPDLL